MQPQIIPPIPWPQTLDYNKQAIEVPGSKRPGQTAAYRDPLWGDKTNLKGVVPGEVLPDLFASGLARGADRDFLGHRPIVSTSPLTFADYYQWLTYGQVDQKRRLVGSALEYLYKRRNYNIGEFKTVGIWSQNRPEWQLIDLACQAYQKVSVSLYDTLGPDVVEYIISHAEIPIVFATENKLSALLTLASKIPTFQTLVSIDPLSPETKSVLAAWGKEKGVEVMDWPEFEAIGAANYIDPLPVTPDTIATICYTSGTTNVPKGVVLTHRNLTSAACSNVHGITFQEGGATLSYLPLAHIYMRACELLVMALGGRVGYWTGDPLRLLEDAQILKPYFFPSVPRVLNRIYQAAMQAAKAPGLKGVLFRKAVEVKLANLRATGNNRHLFWDALVFKKVQAVLGGNVGVVTCGSAPISTGAMEFLRIAFGGDVLEGYGLTETCATATINWPNDRFSAGTIGPPQPCNEIKLLDVPQMGYTSENKPNARGEICVRGRNVFIRYHKDPEKTKEALDDEGWFHTGDVGEIDSNGRIKIIDRIKNIMKLSQGEYVALEKVENIYSACPAIAQIYVHGDSLQDHLVAVVVPDPVTLADLAKNVGLKFDPADPASVQRIVKDPRAAEVVLRAMTNTAKQAGLNGYELAKKIHLTIEPFTIENGTLTPTLKVRRREAAAMWKEVLDGLYRRDSSSL